MDDTPYTYTDPAGEKWTATSLDQLTDAECRQVLSDVVHNERRKQVLLRRVGGDGEVAIELEWSLGVEYKLDDDDAGDQP